VTCGVFPTFIVGRRASRTATIAEGCHKRHAPFPSRRVQNGVKGISSKTEMYSLKPKMAKRTSMLA
jgi:hypothetical protein